VTESREVQKHKVVELKRIAPLWLHKPCMFQTEHRIQLCCP